MTIHPKLEGIPPIYYLNLDHDVLRRSYMEYQFKYWGIENYIRVSTSKFWRNDFQNWSHLIHKKETIPSDKYRSLAVSVSYLDLIKNWLETTNEPYLFMMEDDTDMSLIKYWHFNWNQMFKNIPYDWDGFQLTFNSNKAICCFLHPKTLNSWNGPIIITRYYAEKLLRLYFYDGKYDFTQDSKRKNICPFVRDVDDFLGYNGKVYQIPVFSQKTELDETQRPAHIESNKAHYHWWTVMRDQFSLEDFFTYGKSNDSRMIIPIKI
jgi:hypothetical protein